VNNFRANEANIGLQPYRASADPKEKENEDHEMEDVSSKRKLRVIDDFSCWKSGYVQKSSSIGE